MTLAGENLQLALGARNVLSGARLTVESGQVVAVVGPNGAGKSTLLKCLAGLLTPTAGTILLNGKTLADWPRDELARAIAYLPQERAVHWPLSVETVVSLGRIPYGGRPGAIAGMHRAAVSGAIAAMQLDDLRDRLATELSGGELARVLLARALAQEASVLIADEPTAGLDPAHQLSLFERLRQMAQEEGRCILVALHDLSLAARYCDHIVLLKDGRSVADGPPEAVLTEELLGQVYGIKARLVHIDGTPLVVTASELHLPR